MKNILLIAIAFIYVQLAFSKNETLVNFKSKKINLSKNNGFSVSENDYEMKIKYDDKNLSFSSSNNVQDKYSITKKTTKYIVSVDADGSYSFFDIKKRKFFFIYILPNNIILGGYGTQTNEIKNILSKMMEDLNSGLSDKDVIQYLIKQTEYDF